MQTADSESEQELYTIPSYSSWFSWDEIHQNERNAHSEFFNTTSISKTPKIYKDYRDFIINKYREDPSRRLTFTDVRKCLIGDVGSIHKIFNFLEKWGLINFSASPQPPPPPRPFDADRAGAALCEVVVEDGSPDGVRVVEYPNSGKAMTAYSTEGGGEEGRRGSGGNGGSGVAGLRLPPLTSYSDVFGEAGRRKGCWNCGEDCVAGYYESVKNDARPLIGKQTGSVICEKCFRNENYLESKLADDFKFNDVDVNGTHGTSTWTDEETLLLLEAVMKYGDDWDAVVQQMRTKNKIDCILRLIQLPLGEHMLGTINVKGEEKNLIGHTGSVEPVPDATIENQEPIKTEEQHHEEMAESEQIEEDDPQDPPPKRRCVISFADAGSSLLKQVALLSTAVGPHIAAAAASAAVTTLCNENPFIREIFEAEEDGITEDFGCATMNAEPLRAPKAEADENQETIEESYKQSVEPGSEKKASLSMLHVRAAIATALAAAAAQSKLLADQEDGEIEHLMATIIEAQLKKIQCKMKHFEELESIMEKEFTQIQQIKESVVEDWINVLQRTFSMNIPRNREHEKLNVFLEQFAIAALLAANRQDLYRQE
ncbi:hypothetical protein ACLOJK_002114 [Asimina triloba]